MLGNRRINPIFSFFLTKVSSIPGKVIIGGYDVQKYARFGLTEKDIIWNKIERTPDYFWSLGLQGARFYGGQPILSKQNLIYANLTETKRTLVLDTGLSYALAP